MTTLRDLNRAVQSYPFSSVEFAQAVREWIGAATERMEPASAPDKVECWHCKERVVHNLDHWLSDGIGANGKYTCKPAQPETKVECPNCGVGGNHYLGMFNSGTQIVYSCDPKPAQPEPAANSAQAINARAEAAFAEATRLKTVAAVYIDSPGGQRNRVLTDETDKPVTADTFATDRAIGAQVADAGAVEPVAAEMFPAMRAFLDAFPGQRTIGQWHAADNELKAALRSQAAPAVAMTDELIRVLQAAELDAQRDEGRAYYGTATMTRRAIAAVRSQAGIKLPKVRAYLEAKGHPVSQPLVAALAELDAVEGKVAG